MNWYTFFEGMVVALFGYSGIFSFYLALKNIEKRINYPYAAFTLLMGATVVIGMMNLTTDNVDNLVTFDKALNSAIFLAGAAFILMISELTGYKNKYFKVTLYSILGVFFIGNLLLPSGITFETISGHTPTTILGAKAYSIDGELGPWNLYQSIFLFLLLVYVFTAVREFKKLGNKKYSNRMLLAISLGIGGLLIDTILLQFGFRELQIIDEIGYFAFAFIIGQRNFQNILESGKIKQGLVESEEKFRFLAENASDLIALHDMDFTYRYISPNCSKMMLFSQDELIGENPVERKIIHPDDHKLLFDAFDDFIVKQERASLRFRIVKKNGEYFWAESTAQLVLDPSTGKPIGIQTSTRDITERIAAETKLKHSADIIRYIINAVPFAVVATDLDLNILHYNHQCNKFVDQKSGDLSSSKLFKKFPKLKFIESLNVESLDYIKSVSDEFMVGDDLKNSIYYSVAILPFKTVNERGRIFVIEDVTERKRMDHLLIESEKVLSVAGLAAGMAHEINNPLGTIVQGCQNIIRRTSAGLAKNADTAKEFGIDISKLESYFAKRQIYEIIGTMRQAAEKASGIIKNMLQFSRRSESKKVEYDINRLISEVIELAYNDFDLKKKYDFRTVKIIREFDEKLPQIRITVTEIEQVLFNLIRNAVQAIRGMENNEHEAIITIRTSKDDDWINIEIEDNGPGISNEVKNRVFEPFFTTKEVGEGTGLGLSVSYMIIRTNHEGQIYFDTKIDSGTKFTIKLPVSGENA